jgi:hypothetical protein
VTNEPRLRIVIMKLKQQAEAFLRFFNVSLDGSKAPQPNSMTPDATEALASYGQQPLEIGNELMITEEVVKAYKGLLNAVGCVVVIDQIPSKRVLRSRPAPLAFRSTWVYARRRRCAKPISHGRKPNPEMFLATSIFYTAVNTHIS